LPIPYKILHILCAFALIAFRAKHLDIARPIAAAVSQRNNVVGVVIQSYIYSAHKAAIILFCESVPDLNALNILCKFSSIYIT
jgi:hypothetical protein